MGCIRFFPFQPETSYITWTSKASIGHISYVSNSFLTYICNNNCCVFLGSQFKNMKQRIDGVDKENYTCNYTIIEGDALMDVLESISYNIKIEPYENGGSICKNTSTLSVWI